MLYPSGILKLKNTEGDVLTMLSNGVLCKNRGDDETSGVDNHEYEL
jgi:hypothetical protein